MNVSRFWDYFWFFTYALLLIAGTYMSCTFSISTFKVEASFNLDTIAVSMIGAAIGYVIAGIFLTIITLLFKSHFKELTRQYLEERASYFEFGAPKPSIIRRRSCPFGWHTPDGRWIHRSGQPISTCSCSVCGSTVTYGNK